MREKRTKMMRLESLGDSTDTKVVVHLSGQSYAWFGDREHALGALTNAARLRLLATLLNECANAREQFEKGRERR